MRNPQLSPALISESEELKCHRWKKGRPGLLPFIVHGPSPLWGRWDKSTGCARRRAGVTALTERCCDVAEYSSVRISAQHFPPVFLSSFLQSCLQAIVHSFIFIPSVLKRRLYLNSSHTNPPTSAN